MANTVSSLADDLVVSGADVADLTAADLGFRCEPRTALGRALLEARREFLSEHGRFLTRDEIAREIADGRGLSSSEDEA